MFAVFRHTASRPSRVFRYLSDASYSVYLMHHLVIVALTLALLALDGGPWWKFLLTASLTLACCLDIHHFLILRHPLLAFLFNGKRMRVVAELQLATKESAFTRH